LASRICFSGHQTGGEVNQVAKGFEIEKGRGSDVDFDFTSSPQLDKLIANLLDFAGDLLVNIDLGKVNGCGHGLCILSNGKRKQKKLLKTVCYDR
jgi:hypothetical protein